MGRRFKRKDSYFRDCIYCGQRIHMRQMPAGQWVAFDDASSVHDCRNESAYNDLDQTAATSKQNARRPAPSISLKGEAPPPPQTGVTPTQSQHKTTVPRTSYRAPTSHFLSWVLLIAVLLAAIALLISMVLGRIPTVDGATSDDQNVSAPSATVGVTATSTPRPAPTKTQQPASGSTDSSRITLKGREYVYLRMGPATIYPALLRITIDAVPVKVEGQNKFGDWIAIQLPDGTPGWIYRKFVDMREIRSSTLKVVDPPYPEGVEATIQLKGFDYINVRQGPGLDFSTVGQIQSERERFEVLGPDPGREWYFVRLADSSLGWIKAEFVQDSAAVRALTPFSER